MTIVAFFDSGNESPDKIVQRCRNLQDTHVRLVNEAISALCNRLLVNFIERPQLFDLFYEICFFVVKLFILLPIIVKLGQEVHQFVFVS